MQFARAFLVLGMLSLAACGSDDPKEACEDYCNTECDGDNNPTDAQREQCRSSCDTLAEAAEEAGCESELAKWIDCQSDLACDDDPSADACESETEELSECAG